MGNFPSKENRSNYDVKQFICVPLTSTHSIFGIVQPEPKISFFTAEMRITIKSWWNKFFYLIGQNFSADKIFDIESYIVLGVNGSKRSQIWLEDSSPNVKGLTDGSILVNDFLKFYHKNYFLGNWSKLYLWNKCQILRFKCKFF